jgi:hypothetical protein
MRVLLFRSSFAAERSTAVHFRQIQIAVVIAVILITGICLTGFSRAKNNQNTHEKYFTNITIQSGDTLWTIAQENMTEEYDSIDDYIAEVKDMNHLYSDSITEGHHLVLPHYTRE